MTELQSTNKAPLQSELTNKPFVITLFIILFLLSSVAIYFSYQNQQLKNDLDQLTLTQDSNQLTSTPTPTSTPDQIDNDPTAGWETYISAAYSFKHPQGLKSDTNAAGTDHESIRFQFMGPKQIASGRTQTSLFDGYMFTITKAESNTNKIPLQFAQERASNTLENCGADAVISPPRDITINSTRGAQYTVENCMGDYTNSYFSHQNNLYEVTQLYVGELPELNQYKEVTNQMLNTLNFN